MDRIEAFFATLTSILGRLRAAALAVWVMPALALAQGQNTGRAPSPSGAAPSGGGAGEPAGGAGWLWIVAALVVLAIIWWAMSSRRRHQGTVTR
jgi:hypothetical protein